LSSNDLRGDASGEKLAGASDAETVAMNKRKVSGFPNRGAGVEKGGFAGKRVAGGGLESEEGSMHRDVSVQGEMVFKSFNGAEEVVACSQDDEGTFFFGRLRPRDVKGETRRRVAVEATGHDNRTRDVEFGVERSDGWDGKFT